MPYTPKQRRLFNAMAHDPDIAREHGTSNSEARKLADEANKLKRQGKEKRASFIDLSETFGVKPCG